MKELKNKYVRSVIKLGNSYAMTFPQEWTNQANLKEKSEVSLYPIDDKSIVIKTTDKEKQKTVFNIGDNWPIKLLRHALISAFKVNVDEIYLKYNEKNQDELYKLLTELRREIIGIDFKNLVDSNEFFIYFLLDSSKTTFKEVLSDLIDVFNIIISNVIKGTTQNNNDLLLAEIDRKYSLGRRILITGLSEYPVSKGYRNLPIIQYLGDRVVLLYVKDFINESLNLEHYPQEIIKKYSVLLSRIPSLLIDIVNSDINLGTISEFYDELINLRSTLEKINVGETFEEREIRNTIKYYLNGFQNFFDIGITRLIESEIGMV